MTTPHTTLTVSGNPPATLEPVCYVSFVSAVAHSDLLATGVTTCRHGMGVGGRGVGGQVCVEV